jgi:hypothetical protein
MRPGELLLRCYAEEKRGYWQAFCLDLGLAAQGESESEACGKLNAMIREYLHDALAGEDREYAEYFLTRKAPFTQWMKYYLYFIMQALHIKFGTDRILFKKLVPLAPTIDGSV